MGITWVFIVAVVAVIIYYIIANRSPKNGTEKNVAPERTSPPPTASETPPAAESGEKKD